MRPDGPRCTLRRAAAQARRRWQQGWASPYNPHHHGQPQSHTRRDGVSARSGRGRRLQHLTWRAAVAVERVRGGRHGPGREGLKQRRVPAARSLGKDRRGA